MYAVIRTYSGQGASEVFDVIEQRQEDVQARISGVPGFVSYLAVRSGDGGGVTVTVCEEKAGADESTRQAAELVKELLSVAVDPPKVIGGETVIQFSSPR